MAASGGGGEEVEELSTKEKNHEHGLQCGDHWGDCGEGSRSQLNGNGKSTIKIKFKNYMKISVIATKKERRLYQTGCPKHACLIPL